MYVIVSDNRHGDGPFVNGPYQDKDKARSDAIKAAEQVSPAYTIVIEEDKAVLDIGGPVVSVFDEEREENVAWWYVRELVAS